jgi:hypothetical protein
VIPDLVTSDSSTDSEDPNDSELVRELVNSGKRSDCEMICIRKNCGKSKKEFSAALAAVRLELRTLTDGLPTPQAPEFCVELLNSAIAPTSMKLLVYIP